MGLFECAQALSGLLQLPRALSRRLLALRPDLFIGIDARFQPWPGDQAAPGGHPHGALREPDGLGLASKRVRKIGQAADLVLCLFPFEPAFYAGHGVAAAYVGHRWPTRSIPATTRLQSGAQQREARMAQV
jgi:lipid-A-disaccharide synthase